MVVNGYELKPGVNLARADLSWANLSGANLTGANLSWANLTGANLSGANLARANLSGANLARANLARAALSGANLARANLSGATLARADLTGANLSWANLTGTNLSWADLARADLTGANLSEIAIAQLLIVPQEGDVIGWKKVDVGWGGTGIVKLLIRDGVPRHNATGRKCRAAEAVVLDAPADARSVYDSNTRYITGETVKAPNYDPDRFNECAGGIHFFITREEAENY